MLGLPSSFKLDWGSLIVYIAETASKKIKALIRLTKTLIFFLMLFFISINLTSALAWDSIIESGLIVLNCID